MRKGKLTALLPLFVFVGFLGVGALLLAEGMKRMHDSFQPLEMGREHTLSLSPGEYTLFWERPWPEGREWANPEVQLNITSPYPEVVQQRVAGSRDMPSYTHERQKGVALAEFVILKEGGYTVTLKSITQDPGKAGAFVLAAHYKTNSAWVVGTSLGVSILGVFLGLATLVWTRRRPQKRLEMAVSKS